MATVQISFQDNADNESSFRIYRGTNSTVAKTDEYIAEISLSGSAWSISGQSGSDHQLTSTTRVQVDLVTRPFHKDAAYKGR